MPSRVPTFSDPIYTELVALEGTNYLLTFKWSQRETSWYLEIQDEDGNDLALGLKLVCGIELLGKYVDTRMPGGELWVIPNGSDESNPGLLDLVAGGRCALTYFSVSEILTGVPDT